MYRATWSNFGPAPERKLNWTQRVVIFARKPPPGYVHAQAPFMLPIGRRKVAS